MLDYRTHTFLEVYRQRSFTRAAENLLITQPAASQHIRQMETHYGCTLFVKTGRGIEPTAAADLLYQRLLTMENDEARLAIEAVALAAEPSDTREAPLRLGCTRTIADYTAPRLMAEHLSTHPQAEVALLTGNTRELVRSLEEGTIDFALVEGFFDRQRFDVETLSVRDLLGERLILREAGSGTREILEKHLAARDLAVTDFAGIVEIESIPTIKACVRGGAGITFLYRVAVEEELARGKLADITPDDFAIEHDFCLIWQRGSQYAPRYRSLCDAWRALM